MSITKRFHCDNLDCTVTEEVGQYAEPKDIRGVIVSSNHLTVFSAHLCSRCAESQIKRVKDACYRLR